MNCGDCRYSRTIPGDAHISCTCKKAHDLLEDPAGMREQEWSALAHKCHIKITKAGRGLLDEHGTETLLAFHLIARLSGVGLNPYGVQRAWAMWPINFDPTWVESCDNFEDSNKGTN